MVNTNSSIHKTSMRITKTASEKMRGFGIDERSFFVGGEPFKVFIERYPSSPDGGLSVALIFSQAENSRLAAKELNQLIVLHCIFTNHQMLLTNVTLRKAYGALGTNWQREEQVVFENSREPAPVAFINLINRMTPAKESSDYVKKRIGSWEGYLKIQERGMDIPDIKTSYSKLAFSHDFSRITLTGCGLKDNEWKTLKNLSVRLTGIDGDVGTVIKAANRAVEIELQNGIVKQLREKGHSLHKKEVVFSNFAALSQIRRLRQGFTNLEKGLAVNPNLDRLLFEEKPPVKPLKQMEKLSFHNRLNEFQQQAVSGAVSAEDLYVIQGPPGTGKTTVIAEICLQNAKKGLKTLVASQSNLAVDNALGRLLANKDIRILRVGRTESIEEEGKKFIEENVGQYWKENTLKEITAQYETRKKRASELARELEAAERAYNELQPVYEGSAKAVEEKKAAQEQKREIQSLLKKEQNNLTAFEFQKEQAVRQKRELTEKLEAVEKLIAKNLALLESRTFEWFEEEQKRVSDNIQQLERARLFQGLEKELAGLKKDMAVISGKRDRMAAVIEAQKAVLLEAESVKKVDGLMQVMAEQKIEEVPAITYLINKLEANRENIDAWGKLKKYNELISAAITYVEPLAASANLSIEELKQKASAATEAFTSSDLDRFLEKLRAALKSRQRNDPAVLAGALTGLYKRQNDLWRRGAKLKTADVYIEESKRAFQELKKVLCGELLKQQQHSFALDQKWLEDLETKRLEAVPLERQVRQLSDAAHISANIEEGIYEEKARLIELGKEKAAYEQAEQSLKELQAERIQETDALEENKGKLAEIDAKKGRLQEWIANEEQELDALEGVLSSSPETEYEEAAKKMASLSFTQESLKQEQKNLPLLQSIQKKWLDLLEGANDHDLDEIRKLYIKHANVIGTTCVASARKDFIDNYPVFDVVIIDEVSKATPPELLLPMLKGRKVILVGDHHQLPPLLGNDTLEETLEEMIKENSGFEEKRELEKLLEESLFERLYKNLPEANKTMLAIQYRMHADIMETISPFYELEDKQLQCGLPDSDRDRDHLLESNMVSRSNHLMWLDLPNEPAYFEERMSGGKSLYNPAELQEISRLLVEMNDAAAKAKQEGRIGADHLKSVGVISFYGEQVKRLQRMIDQELRLPHLTIRTGTVDRFQGSEMEIILLSMVRNNQNKHGDIGFAKDYRRLNVALSRAKELLVLIGSSEMFTERAKKDETKAMYRHVLQVVKQKNGLKALQGSRG
ncbi:ATP-binding protein [Planomicrobium sp. CPCC 101110]|uniref:DEAD/DEAH box helicase n=1 Tax=Planomicrobium sp. CPCC 101110 TaxID=2599619 RepID=UPI0011B8490D|nr:AAA domain-containing protein [Planomicrobium sp. CPCC 101110]TWT25264.1 AAA family ATPase [Planomicrobium sp. CPCC 101110]